MSELTELDRAIAAVADSSGTAWAVLEAFRAVRKRLVALERKGEGPAPVCGGRTCPHCKTCVDNLHTHNDAPPTAAKAEARADVAPLGMTTVERELWNAHRRVLQLEQHNRQLVEACKALRAWRDSDEFDNAIAKLDAALAGRE